MQKKLIGINLDDQEQIPQKEHKQKRSKSEIKSKSKSKDAGLHFDTATYRGHYMHG